MTRHHHRIKTFGRWQLKQPYPGIHLWRYPHGTLYLLNHTGTRKLGNTEPAAEHDNLTIDVHPHAPTSRPTTSDATRREARHTVG